jgi:hypothetical protein
MISIQESSMARLLLLFATKDISQLGNYAAIEDVGKATKCMEEERKTEETAISRNRPNFDSRSRGFGSICDVAYGDIMLDNVDLIRSRSPV